MLHFPAVCVDNFYSDPDRVREWALSLEYKPPPAGQWPGKRSEKLHILDSKFFNDFCCKIFSLYFDLEKIDVRDYDSLSSNTAIKIGEIVQDLDSSIDYELRKFLENVQGKIKEAAGKIQTIPEISGKRYGL